MIARAAATAVRAGVLPDRSPITRAGAQAAARRELAKGIYHRHGDPLPVRAIHAIGRFVDHLLSKAAVNAPGGGLGALILVLVIVAVVGLVIWRVGLPQRTAGVSSVFASERQQTAAEHRQRSEQAAARSDWQTATIERMRAVARELEERGTIDPRPGRTAHEIAVAGAAAAPELGAPLRAAAEAFNAVAYSSRPASADQLATVVAADESIRRRSRTAVAIS